MTDSRWIVDAKGQPYYVAGFGALHNRPDIEVIAHALAQINRFTGHACRPYSVAEHSLLCAQIAHERGLPPYVQLACLMHDAHEAYVGDVSSPVKWSLGTAWESFEHPHARAVRAAFGLQSVFNGHRTDVKSIDLIALATERRDLMPWGPSSEPWSILDTPGAEVLPWPMCDLLTLKREQRHWHEWRDEFLSHYHALRRACGAALMGHIHEATAKAAT